MAFLAKDLSVLAYANGFTLWHYKTEQSLVEVVDSNYFNSVAELVRVGDMVMVTANTDATPEVSILSVTANTGGSVSVAPLF